MTPAAAALLVCTAGLANAQEPLTLADALARARTRGDEARLAELDERKAALAVDEARARLLPHLDFTEAWQRGDQPAFVFSSLLTQRRLTEADFEIGRLIRPDALNAVRAALSVEQPVFDAGLWLAHRSARLAHDVAASRRASVVLDRAPAVADAYGAVLRADALSRVAEAALRTAEADLKLVVDRRDAGLATDADALAVEVHLAAVKARRLEAEAEGVIARQALNRLMGDPLDQPLHLAPAGDFTEIAAPDRLEAEALASNPDLQTARLERALADTAADLARAAFLPRVVVRGAVEWNGGSFTERTRAWTVGAEVRFTVFDGLGDRARLARAGLARDAAAIRTDAAEVRVRQAVRAAHVRLEAARARQAVGAAAVQQAREGHRIIRDRYDNGLADISAVLRAAEAIEDAEAQRVGADVDAIVQQAYLDAAVGREGER